VDIESEMVVGPRQRWWLPLSYLLPAAHLHGTVSVRLRGDDRIISISELLEGAALGACCCCPPRHRRRPPFPPPPSFPGESFWNLPVKALLPRLVVRPISFAVSTALQLSEGVWGGLDNL
jgi:hypothetical protein